LHQRLYDTLTLWLRGSGAIFAADFPMYNAFQLQYHSLAEDAIFNFLLKLELNGTKT
jgi:hypothetical protein